MPQRRNRSEDASGTFVQFNFLIINYMKPLNIFGLVILFTGIFILLGFGLYKFFIDISISIVVRLGIIAIILGVIIILISLIRERLNEKKL